VQIIFFRKFWAKKTPGKPGVNKSIYKGEIVYANTLTGHFKKSSTKMKKNFKKKALRFSPRAMYCQIWIGTVYAVTVAG